MTRFHIIIFSLLKEVFFENGFEEEAVKDFIICLDQNFMIERHIASLVSLDVPDSFFVKAIQSNQSPVYTLVV